MTDRSSRTHLVALSLVLGACAGGQGDSETFSSVNAEDSDTDDTSEDSSGGNDEVTDSSDTSGSTDTSESSESSESSDTSESTGSTESTDTTESSESTGEPICARARWTYDFAEDTWDDVPLDAVWTGPNAPPCSVEPAAATFIDVRDLLLVFGTDGMFYLRDAGAWKPPVSIADSFGVLAGETIQSAYFVPPEEGDPSTGVTIISHPNAVLYDVFDDGSAVYSNTVPLESDPDGPNQAQNQSRWAAALADRDLLGIDPDWFVVWLNYEDGSVWNLDGGFEWMGWANGSNAPPFVSADQSPNPSNLEAGWGDYELNRLYIVGPA